MKISLLLFFLTIQFCHAQEYVHKIHPTPHFTEVATQATVRADDKIYSWSGFYVRVMNTLHIMDEDELIDIIKYETEKIYHNNAIRVDSVNQQIAFASGNINDNHNRILRIDYEGTVQDTIHIDLGAGFSEERVYFISDMKLTEDGYIVSGFTHFYDDNGIYTTLPFVAFLLSDGEVASLYHGPSDFHLLQQLTFDKHGTLYGFVTQSSWHVELFETSVYLVTITEEEGFDIENGVPVVNSFLDDDLFRVDYSPIDDAFVFAWDKVLASNRRHITKIDKHGQILWEFNEEDSLALQSHRAESYINVTADGSIIVSARRTYRDDVTGSTGGNAFMIYRLDINGVLVDETTIIRYENDGQRKIGYPIRPIITRDQSIIFAGIILNATDGDQYIMKLTSDLCVTPECGLIQRINGNHLFPTLLTTPRNTWIMHDSLTNSLFKYSFDHKDYLIRSDDIASDESWYKTNQQWTSIDDRVLRGRVYYNFAMETGDSLATDYFFDTLTNFEEVFLEVEAVSQVTLNNGEEKRLLTLSCSNNLEDRSYRDSYWIEDVGAIHGFSAPLNNCHAPTPETMLCFYSNGELLWSNPDYDGCTTSTEDSATKTELILYPNPVGNILYFGERIQRAKIYDSSGNGIIEVEDVDHVDVATLPSAMYFIVISTTDNQSITQKIIKS